MTSDGKTKDLVTRLGSLGVKKAVMIDAAADDKFQRATRNLPKFRYYGVEGLNVYDLLKYHTAIITKDSVKKIVERCGEGE